MAYTVIIFLVLIIIFLIIMIFSLDINIIISFYTSIDNFLHNKKFPYYYSIKINNIYRITNQKKQNKKASYDIIKGIKIFKKHIEIDKLTIMGNISFLDAYNTAKLTGFAYICTGLFISFITDFCNKITISHINIKPIYEEEIKGEIFFECIVKANVGNIITEGIKNHKSIKRLLKKRKDES